MSHPVKSLAAWVTGASLAWMASLFPPPMIQLSLASVPLQGQGQLAVLQSGHWQLSRWNQALLNPELPPISLELNSDGVSGSAGCNRYFGSIGSQEGRRLELGQLASTRRGCEASIMDRESRYLQSLGAVQKYGFTPEGNLWLAYDSESGTGTLEFSPLHVPDER
ncbi:MAG: META domain-containing protein [Phormidium sp. BM_Day4_Bin.17]|nr:META domain-containing protein [Phormidium sp. BM_Day4_Bin.17]UCJ13697.1 MAG: META domain-containing protein [Phormidium sp. PBR-2020]